MRFVIFVVDSQSRSGTTDEIRAIDDFNERLRSNGELVLAAGIAEPAAARVIDGRVDAPHVRPGSVFANDHYFSGFWIIDVASPTVAQERAAQGSRACNRLVELRPFL